MTALQIEIRQGHALELLRQEPEGRYDLILTSPPYWGLRDYGPAAARVWDGGPDCAHKWGELGENGQSFCQCCGAWRGQLGLEPDWRMYVAHLVEIFSEARRALKPAGSLFLNLGDIYAGGWGAAGSVPRKSLVGLPWRVALALVDAGWILRNAIVWRKPNALPTSVRDRFACAYEFLFFFAGSQRYYFDLDAVREPFAPSTLKRIGQRTIMGQTGGLKQINFNASLPAGKAPMRNPRDIVKSLAVKVGGSASVGWDEETGNASGAGHRPLGKNPGDVWDIPTQPYPDAHFAVFPEELCVRPILAACPPEGWVLDPFCGSGTTLAVAERFGRNAVGYEANPQYCEMAGKRVSKEQTQAKIIFPSPSR